MIKGIIFDCFGVLYGGSLEALIAMCAVDRVQQLRDINKQADYGYISGKEYIEHLAEVIGRPSEEIASIIRQKHVRNQPLIDYAMSLRPQYKVGMLSNISSGLMDPLFSPAERAEMFDAVILSYEETLTKPHPAIFELMAERIGLLPEECVMIDDLRPNCDGAEVAGMKSIWHSSNDGTKHELEALLAEK